MITLSTCELESMLKLEEFYLTAFRSLLLVGEAIETGTLNIRRTSGTTDSGDLEVSIYIYLYLPTRGAHDRVSLDLRNRFLLVLRTGDDSGIPKPGDIAKHVHSFTTFLTNNRNN